MGKIESSVKVKIRKTKIQQAVLNSIYTAGVLSVALLTPNALQLLKFFNKRPGRSHQKWGVSRAVKRLEEKGLICFEKKNGKSFVRLTKTGEKYIDILERKEFKIKKPKKWDRKWRIVIFDIKEKRKGTREMLRKTLMRIGFVRLQNSVWVYPYDCEDLLIMLKADFYMGKDVLYIVADEIENEKTIRTHFDL